MRALWLLPFLMLWMALDLGSSSARADVLVRPVVVSVGNELLISAAPTAANNVQRHCQLNSVELTLLGPLS